MINVFQPALGTEELAAVKQVFDSNWVGKGQVTAAFETEFAAHLGVSRAHILSLSCCTEALFQCMALLDLSPGDEVILPTISFVGAANAIAACGATPVFCDVDPRSLNATAAHIDAHITERTRAVMVLHYGGVPCQMKPILALCESHHLTLIEDSACSVGSRYEGQACGVIGDLGAWSFDAMKILVAGDGAMLYCKDPQRVERATRAVHLGLVQQSGLAQAQRERADWWEFEISDFGRRAIMNDITAAIGREQLKKLPGFLRRRAEIHALYTRALADLDWLCLPPPIPVGCESSYYFYWLQMAPEVRDRLALALRDRQIYTTFRYHPLHCVRLYGSSDHLPDAERAAQSTLCIPLHHALTDEEVRFIIAAVRGFGRKYL